MRAIRLIAENPCSSMAGLRTRLEPEFKRVDEVIEGLMNMGCIEVNRSEGAVNMTGSPRSLVHRVLFGN